MKTSPELLFADFQRTGNRRSLAQVVDLLGPQLLLVSRRFTRDANEAEDLVQDTFVRAIEAAKQYDSGRPLRPWLVTILCNHARRLRSAGGRTVAREGRIPIDPRAVAESKELVEAVELAFTRMPRQYGEVLRLHLFHALSLREISRTLDRPIGTVKAQHRRGMDRLRSALPSGLALSTLLTVCAGRGWARVRADVIPRRAAGLSTPVRVSGLLLVLVSAALWRPGASGPAHAVERTIMTDLRVAARPVEPRREPTAGSRTVVATSATVKLSVRWRASGAAAAGVRLRLEPRFEPGTHVLQSSYPRWIERATDAAGNVEFANCPSGTARLFLDDGRVREDIEIPATGVVQRAVELRAIHHVCGIVTDASGQPVANAEILSSGSATAGSPGFVAGHSDEDGRFQVRILTETCWVWARAPGHSVSRVISVPSKAQISGVVRLELGAATATVRGCVRSADGSPVARAVIGVYRTRRESSRLPHCYRLTASDGSFSFHELWPGDYWVVARHSEHGSAIHARVKALRNQAVRVELELRRGATIKGRVLWDRSVAHDRLRIVSRPAWLRRRDVLGLLCSTSAVTRDGEFALSGVLEGTARILATDHRSPGSALLRRDFNVASAGHYVRHLVVGDVLAIRGKVVDDKGRGLAGVRVRTFASDKSPELPRIVSTDSRGTFVLPGLQTRPYQLCFIWPDGDEAYPSKRIRQVYPNDGELRVRLDPASRPTARIRARLASRLIGRWSAASLVGGNMVVRTLAPIDATTGEVQFGPLPPGKYRVVTRATDSVPSCTLAEVRVRPGQNVKLFDLDPGDPVRVQLDLRHADGRAIVLCQSARILDAWGMICNSVSTLEDGRATLLLHPGDYELVVHGGHFATYRHPLSIRAGATKRVSVRVRPARRCGLRFTFSRSAGIEHGLARLAIVVRDSSGNDIYRANVPPRELHYYAEVGLTPGIYTVEGRAHWGGYAVKTFVVTATHGPKQRVRLSLDR